MERLFELSTLAEATPTQWTQAVKEFCLQFNDVKVFNSRWEERQKVKVLECATDVFRTHAPILSADDAVNFLRAFKIITRDRTGIYPLCDEKNVQAFINVVSPQSPEPVALEACFLITNLLVLDRARISPIIRNLQGAQAFYKTMQVKSKSDELLHKFSFLRVFFLISLDTIIAKSLILDCSFYNLLIELTLSFGDPKALAVPENGPVRKLVSECCKVMFNLMMEESLPAITTTVDKELYTKYQRHLARILAVESREPAAVEREFMEREAKTKEKFEKYVVEKAARLEREKEKEQNGDTTLDDGPSATRNEADDDIDDIDADTNCDTKKSGGKSLSPFQADLLSLKEAVSHLFLYLPESSAALLTEDICSGLGLLEILDERVSGPKSQLEDSLSPTLQVLHRVCKNNDQAREYVKRYLFGFFANDGNSGLNDPSNIRPENQQVESDPTLTKNVLLACLTTFQYTLKQAASEFLWLLAKEDTAEYIRLTGFGNAVGLLADKGLPGFQHLASQAIDISTLMGGKKL